MDEIDLGPLAIFVVLMSALFAGIGFAAVLMRVVL